MNKQKTEPCLFFMCGEGGSTTDKWEGCMSNCTCASVQMGGGMHFLNIPYDEQASAPFKEKKVPN